MKKQFLFPIAGLLLGLSSLSLRGEDVKHFDITKGVAPGGKGEYKGTVTATKREGDAVGLDWKLNDGSTQRGVGFLDFDKKTLLAAFGGAEKFGVVVYEKKDGKWTGKFTTVDNPKATLGTEVLEGPDSGEGEFKITKGVLMDGKTPYTGTLTVTANGEALKLHWALSDGSTQEGVGIKRKDALVSSWDKTGTSGAVAYDFSGETKGKLTGVWALGDAKELGTEELQMKEDKASANDAPKADPKEEPKTVDDTTGKVKEAVGKDLTDAIAEDLKKCGPEAMKFMGALKEGKVDDAVAVLDESAAKTARKKDEAKADLTATLEKLGELTSFQPDKKATDFGVKDGVMQFHLFANGDAKKGKFRVGLHFAKTADGVALVDYDFTQAP